MNSLISILNLQKAIIEIQGLKVLLDSDIAGFYGIQTKRVNEVVRNNPEKFPEGYNHELSSKEWSALKSKFSTSTKGGKVKPPSAFPEKGLYKVATMKSRHAALRSQVCLLLSRSCRPSGCLRQCWLAFHPEKCLALRAVYSAYRAAALLLGSRPAPAGMCSDLSCSPALPPPSHFHFHFHFPKPHACPARLRWLI